jgi:hypothetical protein
MVAGGLEFLSYVVEDKWRAHDVRNGVFNRRPASLAATVDQDATDLPVTVQIRHPLAVHPEDAFDLGDGHRGPRGCMIRVLDDDLAGTTA